MNFKKLTTAQNFVLNHAVTILCVNLILAATISLSVHFYLSKAEKERSQARQDKLIQDFHLAFDQYVHPLEGILSTLHYSKLNVTPESFRTAAESRNLFKNFTAALGFGFIRKVKSSDLKAFVERQKAKRKEFAIKHLDNEKKTPDTQDAFIVEVVEPIEKNASAVGLVISDNTLRREAAIQAMYKGQSQITKLTPLSESDSGALGFVYYLPIYKTATIPATQEEKENQLFGWAYAPLLAKDILAFVSAQNPDALPFQLVELDFDMSEKVIYESKKYQNFMARSLPFFRKNITINGQRWKISSVYDDRTYQDIEIKSILVGLILSIASLLFYYYSRLLQKRLQFDSQLILLSREEVKIATRELLEQKAFLQTVIDGLPALVGYWDKNFNNRLSNKMYEDFFGPSSQLIFGKPAREQTRMPYLNNISIEEGQEIEKAFINKSGEARILLTKYQPHKVDGVLEGFTVIGIDVTDIRNLENKNRESEALLFAKAKLSLLGEMACGIAHEINNPLAIVLGKSNILKDTIEAAPDDFAGKSKVLSDLGAISRTATRMAAIVKGLRSFARDSEDDPNQNADLKGILENVFSLIQERIKSKGIFLDYNSVRSDQILFCNRTQIEQVFMNLISNSIDAVSELPEKWIKIEVQEINHTWQVRLSDSGAGIPAEVVEKMMNPFFTTKAVGRGTGLGLSICKSILEKHQAVLIYELYEAHTSFLIRFPKSVVIESV